MIVTIDGPAGSGKSTAARRLAAALGIACLETGATYRAVTLAGIRRGIDLADEQALRRVAREADIRFAGRPGGVRVLLDGQDVTGDLRRSEITDQAYHAATSPAVREVLVDLQRRIGRALGSLVAEGRDQGTVVFPDADVKFYLDAAPSERARRRCADLAAAGESPDYPDVLAAIRRRDERDRRRAVGPLAVPDDAVRIDTTDNTIDETAEQLLRHVRARTGPPAQ
jgi:cytidylate kinase